MLAHSVPIMRYLGFDLENDHGEKIKAFLGMTYCILDTVGHVLGKMNICIAENLKQPAV